MANYSDEKLSAFLDGALDQNEENQIKADIQLHDSLRFCVEQLRQLDDLLKHAYPIDEELPDELLATVLEAPTPHAARPEAGVNVLINFVRRWVQPFFTPATVTAALALAVGVFVGQSGFLQQSNDEFLAVVFRADAAVIDKANPIYDALEKAPSNKPVELARSPMEVFVKPILSFTSSDERFCREFEITAGVAVSVGVACRETDAHWTLEILLAADERSPDTHLYQPASGYDQKALDAVLSKLMSGPAMSPDEEAQLLQKNSGA